MAASNPNPTYITDDMWWLWLACLGFIPGVRLGGIYANKSGWHNTVNANLSRWPGNYSVRNPIDRRDPKTKARAIDLTMNATWMRIITQRLLDGAARRDPRMRCVKEFYGTVNGSTVVGRIKDSEDGPYRSASSDASHTWHVHGGILTPYVDDRDAMEGLASLLKGESLASWQARTGGTAPATGLVPEPTLREGDTGPRVGQLQRALNTALGLDLAVDEGYGLATTTAVRALQRLARITEDGIYGDGSAAALKRLLENDMPTPKELWHTDGLIDAPSDAPDRETNPHWAPASVLKGTLERVYHLPAELRSIKAQQATQETLLKQILAGQSGLTEAQITAAVAEGVRQSVPSAEDLAAAVAAAVDHDLDTAAVTEALREVLGSLDGTAA